MEALIPLSKALTITDVFQREKVGDLLLCIRCSHVKCLHGSSSGSPGEELSWCGKTNSTSHLQNLTAGGYGFRTARGPVIDESTSQTFKWPSRDYQRMIPQRTVCCLGSLGEKINMRHILYGQEKQLWFTYKHLLSVQCPGVLMCLRIY